MDYLLAIFVGIGLSISAGFRIFTPLFVISIVAVVIVVVFIVVVINMYSTIRTRFT